MKSKVRNRCIIVLLAIGVVLGMSSCAGLIASVGPNGPVISGTVALNTGPVGPPPIANPPAPAPSGPIGPIGGPGGPF